MYIIILVVLALYVFSLSGRVSFLEEKLLDKNHNLAPTPNLEIKTTTNPLPPVQNYASQTVAESAPNGFWIWLKEDWLMKLGAFLFIIGFGWFVSYAFANNWIGPVGRISLGVVSGILIMTFGFIWMMKYASQGAVFMALGAGMSIMSIFAGRSLYGFFTPVEAVAFDFILVSFIAFASYKFNIKSLGLLSQVLAFLTPLLVAGETDVIFLFTYLLLVSLATLLLASATGWRNLITSSLFFVGLYSLPYLSGFSGDLPTRELVLNFIYVFSLLYLFSGMLAVVKNGVENAQAEISLAVFNGLLLFAWISGVAKDEWTSLIFAVWAVVFAVGSFTALWIRKEIAPFYAYGSVAAAFIAAATAAELHGAVLTIAFIFEIFFMVLLVLRLTNNLKAATNTALLFVVPMFLSLESILAFSRSKEIFTQDFFVLIWLAIALLYTGRYLIKDNSTVSDTNLDASDVYGLFGVLYFGYLVWQIIHIMFITTPDFATMVALVIYTIIGLAAYLNGLHIHDLMRKTYGIALIGFVVVRLLLVDIWGMELFGKVITFIAIGVLLMSTALVTRKNKNENITN